MDGWIGDRSNRSVQGGHGRSDNQRLGTTRRDGETRMTDSGAKSDWWRGLGVCSCGAAEMTCWLKGQSEETKRGKKREEKAEPNDK